MKLKNKTDMLIAKGCQFLLCTAIEAIIIYDYLSLVVCVHGGQQVEESRLAAAGFANKCKEFASFDLEVYVFQDMKLLGLIKELIHFGGF